MTVSEGYPSAVAPVLRPSVELAPRGLRGTDSDTRCRAVASPVRGLLYYRYCQILVVIFEYRKYWYYRYYLVLPRYYYLCS